MLPMNKSELVELIVTPENATQTKLVFQDLPQLREKLVDSIETYCVDDIPKSTTGNALVSSTQMAGGYFVFYLSDPDNLGSQGEFVKYFPLVSMHRVQNSAGTQFVRQIPKFKSLQVQWPKCYVWVPTPLGNTGNVSFLFNVYYHNKGGQA